MARQVSGGEQCGGGWSGAARLSRVLDDVERLCAELGEMSRRQGMDLDEGRAEDAAAVVGERVRLVARLEEAARELGPDAESFERRLREMPEAAASRARAQAAAMAAAVGAVLARDAEDAELLRGERDRLSSEMSGLGRGKSAIGAYGGAREAGPTMQDREG